ncbi:hypothetical protein [Frankia sp. Cr2]|uniref:hypothetical protein n=1 Tax=Frankia sp. Cr2 TaxID=3073932 RepID=UPI002AD2D48F|nr:hypothetical protein [Frankia sp. Cr2]
MTDDQTPAASRHHPQRVGPSAQWPADTSAEWLETNIGDVLRTHARERPERAAVSWQDGDTLTCLTYSELLAAATRVAQWLLELARPRHRRKLRDRSRIRPGSRLGPG